jgi:hypothetical protein
MTRTAMTSEVTIKILSAEERRLHGVSQLRSDRLAAPPAGVFVGQMRMLEKPEPIRPKRKAR